MKRFLSLHFNAMSQKSNAHLHEIIQRLNYDFCQFEINHFLQHIAQQRQREICVQGFAFDASLFGVWIPRQHRDYIAYNNNTYHIHHVHIILHEVGHMLLGHQPASLEAVFGEKLPQILAILGENEANSCVFLSRRRVEGSTCSNPQEEEAETFSTLIQNEVMRANRFEYLVNTSTSISRLKVFTDALGFQE